MSHLILVVEDEPSISENICYALHTEGFDVLKASTLSEARDYFDDESVDLVVLDVNLPDGSGFEQCKEWRTKTNIPILFLSSRSSEIDRVVGLEIGADDYVVKPFSPRELTARVRNILRRTNTAVQQQALGSTSFVVDSERKQICYGGIALELSRYEFGLLHTLIKHPARVYSRDELMNLVWEEPAASFDRTVDAHIKNIRNKIRSVLPDDEVIITHRGMGYSFSEKFR